MRRHLSVQRRFTQLVVAALMVGACSSSKSTEVAPGSTLRSTVPPTSGETETDTTDTSTAPTGDSLPAQSTTTETVAEVVTEIAGSAVASSSGGEGPDQTNTRSEAVRFGDGTCAGWSGPDDGTPWTAGLEQGAPVTILAREGADVIGSGTITSAIATDVDPGDDEQWMCTFSFSGTVSGRPDSFRIKVANLLPWVARPDPTRAGEFVASVDSKARADLFGECTDGDFGSSVTEWSVVGQFWANGFPSLCASGLDIASLDRPCRPATIASDYIIAVVDAGDPTLVYEDSTGLLVDVTTLAPGTKVTVVVATGRPCG